MITLSVFLVFFVLIAGFVGGLMIASYTVDFTVRITPSYAKEDLTEVLAKESWTDEDYEFLYRQTGLGKRALDGLKSSPAKIQSIQEGLFYEGELKHEMTTPATPHDVFVNYTLPIVPLEDGDVIVTSSTHTYGWRNGHAALITDGFLQRTLESFSIGSPSGFSSTTWFQRSCNFMVLRLKEEYAKEASPAEIAKSAKKTLAGIDYSVFVGFFSYPKDQCENGRQITVTQCSHLVWQAYKNFGLDIDENGGPLVTPRDIARSPLFDVVQVNGFDLDKLW